MKFTGALLCFFVFAFVGTKCDDDDDDGIYALKMTDSMHDCKDFDNKVMDCSDMKLSSVKLDDGSDEAKLAGKIITLDEIQCDYDIEIDIWKIQDMKDEYMYNMKMTFGASLKDPDAPWYPVFETLNISECPVASATFEIAELNLSLNCVKDVLCHDFCGNYLIIFKVVNITTVISCHTLEMSIVEIDKN